MVAISRAFGRQLRARSALATAALATSVALAPHAFAQPTGQPPEDARALVAGPGDAPKPPEKVDTLDVTTATISAGGQLSTGNSRLLAGTVSGDYQTRFSNNGIGLSLLGNYGESATPGSDLKASAQNVQGRVRYDRYLLERFSLFLINTGRHDRFQGLDFRYNLDPGAKYLFVQEDTTKLWGELGYDFQYDVRRNDSLALTNADGTVTRLDKTATDHSTRLFAGFSHAFNDAVNLNLGLEYLQSVVHATQNRVNFDALFAAKLGGGLALGVGFGARYDHAPLPDKKKLDTQSILTLIYAFSNAPSAEPAPPPCPPAPACPTPEAAPPVPPTSTPLSNGANPAPTVPAEAPAEAPVPPPVAPAPLSPPVGPTPATP